MSEQEINLDIQHFFSSGVYVRQMHLPAGHFAQSHRHKFEHVSILAQGEVLLEVDDVMTRHCAPALYHDCRECGAYHYRDSGHNMVLHSCKQ